MSKSEYDIENLIRFVDEEFKPFDRLKTMRSSGSIWPVLLLFLTFFSVIIAASTTPSFLQQIPWILTFSAVAMATFSFLQASRKQLERNLLDKYFNELYSRLPKKTEQSEFFLRSLILMKIRNPKLKLQLAYQIEKKFFRKEELLKMLYE